MNIEEFKALKINDLVVARDSKGRGRILEKIGPSHYRQGLGEKEMFALFLFVNTRKKIIKANREIRNKIDFNTSMGGGDTKWW